MKVLGTTTGIPYEYYRKVEMILGESLTRNEFRIICRCRGLNDANRKCEEQGFREHTFSREYTCETHNQTEIELCETEDIWIAPNKSGKKLFVSVSQLINME